MQPITDDSDHPQPPTSKISLPFNICLRLLVRLPDAEQRTARGRDRAIAYGRAFPSIMDVERAGADLTEIIVGGLKVWCAHGWAGTIMIAIIGTKGS